MAESKAVKDTVNKLLREGGRTISDADRKRAKRRADFKKLIPKNLKSKQTDNTISDADLRLLEEAYMKRNDGGIARKTRTF